IVHHNYEGRTMTKMKLAWYEDPKELRKRRIEAGLSAEQLGQLVGKSLSVIKNLESGRTKLQGELREAVWTAIGEAKIEQNRRLVSLASLQRSASAPPEPKQVEGHHFNLKVCKTGGYNLEYQGPGMPVCEDYHFANVDEVMEFTMKFVNAMQVGDKATFRSE